MATTQGFPTANGVSDEERGLGGPFAETFLTVPKRAERATPERLAAGLTAVLANVRASPLVRTDERTKDVSALLPALIEDVRTGYPRIPALNRAIALTALRIFLDPTNSTRYSPEAPLIAVEGSRFSSTFQEVDKSEGNASSKCNLFVFDVLSANGVPDLLVRFVKGTRNAGAGELADRTIEFPHLSGVTIGIDGGAPGDVIAFRAESHTGIYVGNRLYVGATTAGVTFRGEASMEFVCLASVEAATLPVLRRAHS